MDADTLDLLRLETQGDDIPEEVEISTTVDSVEYAQVRIGSDAFLLPSASELRITIRTGRESRNRTRFTNCRQYLGESTISFADAAPAAETPIVPRTVQLPANLSIEAALAATIDIAKSALGDPVSLVVTRPVKKGSMIPVPKGTVLQGRLTRLDKHPSKEGPFHVIGIQLLSFDTGDSRGDHREPPGSRDRTTVLRAVFNRRPPALDLDISCAECWKARGRRTRSLRACGDAKAAAGGTAFAVADGRRKVTSKETKFGTYCLLGHDG